MTLDKTRTARAAAVFIISSVISTITALLPIFFSVGKVVYANIVPTTLAAIELGPVGGALYALLAGFVLNSIGMGSGVLAYVMIFQVIEAIMIGFVWHGKKMTATRFFAFAMGAAFILKPLSYALFYIFNIFNRQIMGETGPLEYMAKCYAGYLKGGWRDTLSIYATSVICAWLMGRLLSFIFEKHTKGANRP